MNAHHGLSNGGLPGLDVRTVQEVGWAGVKNGELLRRAEAAGFSVFITTDQNLRYQQNLAQLALAFIVLPSNQVPIVAALLVSIRQCLATLKLGDVVVLPMPP